VYTPTSSSTTDWWGTQIRGLPVRNSYVDGVPMLLHWGGDFPTEVIESVTALKGLTGFMYGFGEPGGALSYKLKRPKAANETTVNALVPCADGSVAALVAQGSVVLLATQPAFFGQAGDAITARTTDDASGTTVISW
jgi:outer membrane receptor for ferric coprogen and ferric-rhodotorulic acid